MVLGTPTPLEEIFIYTAVCREDAVCMAVVIVLLFIVSVVIAKRILRPRG